MIWGHKNCSPRALSETDPNVINPQRSSESVVHSSEPALAKPRQWFITGFNDLRRSGRASARLFQADLRIRHRRALLGYIWLVLPGIAMAVAFTWLREDSVFSTRQTPIPYPVFVLSGLFLWQVFVEGVSAPLQNLKRYSHMLGRVSVPHEAVLLAALLRTFLNASIRCALLVGVALYFDLSAGGWAAFLVIALLGWAIGLCLTPFGMLYDDVERLISVGALFGIFLTPVLYPIPEGSLLALNPLVPIFDAARHGLDGTSSFVDAAVLGTACVGGLFLAALGWGFYRIAKPHFMAAVG